VASAAEGLPPWETVYWHFKRWRDDGSLDALHDALRERVREADGREAQPTAAIIDAQSVKGADTVGRETRGYDAGKKVNGRKRHIVVDTIGPLVIVMITAANVQDRDGARPALAAVRRAFPAISLVWADGGYAGKLVERAKQTARLVLEIVRKPEGQRTFEVLPRRWVVERTLAWITKCRRLDHDYERLTTTSMAMVKWAMVGLIMMTRRLAPTPGRRPWSTP
jgi:transposase